MAAKPRATADKKTYRGRFALHIRHLREKSGKSAEQVAGDMGAFNVTVASIYHWESGRRTPSLEQLYALARALGLSSISDILPPK